MYEQYPTIGQSFFALFVGLIDELQFNYRINKTNGEFEILSDKFDDIIANGKIVIEIQNTEADKKLIITYYRRLKGIGFIVILFSIIFCYIGVIIPYLIMQNTKKMC